MLFRYGLGFLNELDDYDQNILIKVDIRPGNELVEA